MVLPELPQHVELRLYLPFELVSVFQAFCTSALVALLARVEHELDCIVSLNNKNQEAIKLPFQLKTLSMIECYDSSSKSNLMKMLVVQLAC